MKLEWRIIDGKEIAEYEIAGWKFRAQRVLRWRPADEVGLAIRADGEIPDGYCRVPGWEDQLAAPSFAAALVARAWQERRIRMWEITVWRLSKDRAVLDRAVAACVDADGSDLALDLAIELAEAIGRKSAAAGGDN